MKTTKPFAVRYKESRGDPRPKLSKLRFATATEAREYALRLIDCGARAVAIVQLDGRRYISITSVWK